jgi:hypothetical protein
MKRWSVLLTVILVLLLAVGAQANSPFGRRAKARATADASHALAALKLPGRARRVKGDHSVNGILGTAPMSFRNVSQHYVIDDMSFWHVSGKPRDVARWLRRHPPDHIDGIGTDGPYPFGVQFGFADQPGVNDHFLTITLARAKGGGTAVRADGTAVWYPNRRRQPSRQGEGHAR